ncbi:exosortase family protein XrtF [Flavobacterium sufflavum]|uniref:Exosortase family protein XrtF n=1 Tax=Flavobacterium sufflavum TaxID=1921138 RepID=A0A437KQZ3_9FLAO|nr:exosortase family protein XrtF [Flavobacterium sufflavum]RVT74361.1 exosortase family protein XrtF [Flavobacterium sufflavum]
MKKYLILYRPFLIFLAKFFLTYLVLSLIYQGYLSRFDEDSVDALTKFVAGNTEQLLALFNIDFYVREISKASYVMLYYNQQAIARMIEGCNAISVIILFVSFVVSFSGKLKPTLLFILGGSVFIYILNVIRIALLCSALYWFPLQETVLHEIVFPLFIYGAVFILWVVWVNKFSLYAK